MQRGEKMRGKTGTASILTVNKKSRFVKKKLAYEAKKWTGTDTTSKKCLVVRKDAEGNLLGFERINDSGRLQLKEQPKKKKKYYRKRRKRTKKKET